VRLRDDPEAENSGPTEDISKLEPSMKRKSEVAQLRSRAFHSWANKDSWKPINMAVKNQSRRKRM